MPGILVVWLAVLAVIFLDISHLTATPYANTKLLVKLYLSNSLYEVVGAYFARRRKYDSENFQKAQETFLIKLLSKTAKTSYGEDHRFSAIKSVADFRLQHPLTKYAHYANYVERVARGEENVLVVGKLSRISLTSGTTGNQKLIPVSKERQLVFLFKIGALVTHLVSKRFARERKSLQTICLLYVHSEPKTSKGSITMGPISMMTISDNVCRLLFSTPPAGMKLKDERQAMYVHLLFALRDPTIKCISGFFSANIYRFFSLLEEHWPTYVEDLRNGRISDHAGRLPEHIKSALEAELRPEPKRAEELEEEFRKGFVGIAKRIWPHMFCMYGISSGAASVYARRLEKTYTQGIPIVSTMYTSTEGVLGTLYGDDHQYVLDAGNMFYEFIPIDRCDEDQPDTLLAEEVEVGETYEVVITTMDALYRYRNGDVVKVTGFYGTCPIVDFQYRSGEFLNLKGEKTPEVSVRTVVMETFCDDFQSATLVDYACVESVLFEEATGPTKLGQDAYYVIFIEVDTMDNFSVIDDLEEITASLDTKLRQVAAGYDYQRKRNGIAQLRLVFVHPGSFSALRSYILAHSEACAVQVKSPKKLDRTQWIRFLAEREVKYAKI
ncbi:uncharacterized protein [Diadema antillarum]|uniref:uncharacterized protein n=1 Tax=Diadema antillarum TaxID=105358 RepID=UPI003A840DEF